MKGYPGIILLLLLPQLAHGAAGVADVAESDPGLFIVMMMLLAGFIAMVLFLMVFFALVAGILLLLAGAGIVSLSVLSAWYHRSLAKGLSTFFLLCLMAAGCGAAALGLFILSLFNVAWASDPTHNTLIICAGAAAGWVSSRIILKVVQQFVARIRGEQ